MDTPSGSAGSSTASASLVLRADAPSKSCARRAKSVRHFSRCETTTRKVSDTFCCCAGGFSTEQRAESAPEGKRGYRTVNDQSRCRNSSRVSAACSRMDSRVPRGISLPYGTITSRTRPDGSRFMNARWLPFPRSGASVNPALRSAWIIALEESDGRRIKTGRCQAAWRTGPGRLRRALRLQEGRAAWRWSNTTGRLLPAPPAPCQA